MRVALLVAAALGLAVAAWLLWGQTDEDGSPTPDTDTPVKEGDADHADPELTGRPGSPASPVPHPPDDDEPGEGVPVALGVVVDAKRQPVAGAEVVATIEGRETGRTRSADDGTFEVALLPRGNAARFGRMVIRKDRRGAVRRLYVAPDGDDRIDYGRIALAPTHAVTVRVLRARTPVAGAQVVLGQTQGARPGTQFAVVRTDAEGLAHFEDALGPRVGIHAWAEGAGRAHREVGLPVDSPVDLELPEDRRATIRVKRADTGSPVAGAEVFLGGGGTLAPPAGTGCLPAYPELRTGDDGTLAVSGLPEGYVMVVARAPNLGMRNQGMTVEHVILQPTETEKTVTLHPYRMVKFPISGAGAGAPAVGTKMEVRRYQPLVGYDVGQPEARIEDSHLVLEPFPPGHDWGHVVTEDGRWAKWMIGYYKDVGDPVEFRTIYDARVRLQWRDGSPAAGQVLWASLQPRGQTQKVRTDDNGEALFSRLIAETMSVLWTPTEAGFGMPIGSVSLVTDPGVQTLTIDRPIEIALTLRRGGEPFIPDGLEVRVPDLDPDRPSGGDRPLYREIQEDPTRGELAFRWLPMPDGTAPPVTVRGKDVAETTITPKRADDGVWRAQIDLAQSSTLRVRVVKPEGGRYWLKLERWIEEENRWLYLHDYPGYRQARRAVEGTHTFPTLGPGRYRLVEGHTKLASEPIEVHDGADVEFEFDLTAVVVVKGRVHVPEGEDPAYAALHVKGRVQGQVSESNPARVKPDGTFEFRAPRGDRLTLVAQHPLLRPQGDPPSIVVGKEEPVVRFVPGPHLVFRLEGSDLTTHEPSMSTSPSWWSPVQVRIRPPGAWDSGGGTNAAIAKNGRCRCAAPGPGTWTVRVEQPGFVPILLEDVKIGSGPTDLGTLRFSKGATLTVRLLGGDAGLPKNLRARAVYQGEHTYSCSGSKIEAGDPPTITMHGLGQGQFRVSVQRMFVNVDPLAEVTVESDGESALTVDVRLP